ncbi:hypothetical protein BT63DRAFT_460615 [Microthyrium microscopicum]|uniref:LDB19 N-terminal domain-containing protein n=1 Tax=Microthyrium microscopicum TaxID=703497 RepID=A0A6A6TWX3_9PEZI|nr:hypothetical protein BT63DRAFT_460615 [Microthyrium microscopicum]
MPAARLLLPNALHKIQQKASELRVNAASISSSLSSSLSQASSSTSSLGSFASSDRPDRETMDMLKRHSISLNSGKSQRKDSSSSSSLFTIELVTESPPLISYNESSESTGAIYSGEIKIRILSTSPQIFEKIEVRLLRTNTIRKPVSSSCPDCSSISKTLKTWQFVPEESLSLSPGDHKFPISYLFPGEYPTTTHSHLAQVDYAFKGIAQIKNSEKLTFAQTVELKRAIRPGLERQSIRVFPPTNMAANVKLTPVCFTNSEIPVTLKLSGITTIGEKQITRWRLRRLLWRVEEYQRIWSPACAKHQSKLAAGQQGIKHEEIKTIGDGEVSFSKNPWKTDLSTGEINSEFVAILNPKHKVQVGSAVPDINLMIWHHLVVEMIVVEEWATKKTPTRSTPTGAARILRSQFPLKITNRAGQGVAWDEEIPPMYQDVPSSPPIYQPGEIAPMTPGLAHILEIDIAHAGEAIEDFHLGEPHAMARQTAVASSSRVTRRGSSASRERPQRAPLRLSVDDFMQEPPEYRRNDEDEEPEVDLQVVDGSAPAR